MERMAVIIMSKFEPMWNTFMAHRGSFEPFMDLYLRRWLHSYETLLACLHPLIFRFRNEIVTLTTTTPERKVRIMGITSDFGLLRTVPVNSGWSSNKTEAFIDLQPDGNSFDIMAGLIKTKN
jgi:biotin--protein ligase